MTSTSGSASEANSEQLEAEVRVMKFARNLLYTAQLHEILPLLQEVEEFSQDDDRVKLINAVLDEALQSFPLADTEV
tara:strand:- start:508 stop:738 length:231 start_codon:yes stop_codon:yes gene_type:complete